jgi:hypothetical protein
MTFLQQSDKSTMFLPFTMNANEETLAKVLVQPDPAAKKYK